MLSCIRARLLQQARSSLPRPASILPLITFTTTSWSTRGYATETYSSSKPLELNSALSRTTDLFKTYKPVTPGLRHLRRPLALHLYKGRPVRQLTLAKRKKGGRNAHGVITVRHRGGGHRQRIRLIDFNRKEGGVWDVVRIEYDPGRSAHIALVQSRVPEGQGPDGKKWAYILATDGMRAGDEVQSFRSGIPEDFLPGFVMPSPSSSASTSSGGEGEADSSLALGILRTMTLKPGNVLPLRLIPTGTIIHNISLKPDGPGILVRSAGSFGQVVAHEDAGRYSQVRLQSGEVRKVLQDCCATIGKVSNPLWNKRQLGKAGRSRWLGWRPTVRGVAMNACVLVFSFLFQVLIVSNTPPPFFLLYSRGKSNDHPHGGGRGKSKSNKHPVSIWGWGTKGTRTRKPGPKGPKNSNKMVIRERPRGKEKRSN